MVLSKYLTWATSNYLKHWLHICILLPSIFSRNSFSLRFCFCNNFACSFPSNSSCSFHWIRYYSIISAVRIYCTTFIYFCIFSFSNGEKNKEAKLKAIFEDHINEEGKTSVVLCVPFFSLSRIRNNFDELNGFEFTFSTISIRLWYLWNILCSACFQHRLTLRSICLTTSFAFIFPSKDARVLWFMLR